MSDAFINMALRSRILIIAKHKKKTPTCVEALTICSKNHISTSLQILLHDA
jgi:hypothetical protein